MDAKRNDPLYHELTEVRSIGNPARLFFRIAAAVFVLTFVMAKQPWVEFPDITSKISGHWQQKK